MLKVTFSNVLTLSAQNPRSSMMTAIEILRQLCDGESRYTAFRRSGARISMSMTKETKNSLIEGTIGSFEWLAESDTLFVYVVIPLLCVIGLYILGTIFYQFIINTHPASASAASDFLSIDPDKWFPRA